VDNSAATVLGTVKDNRLKLPLWLTTDWDCGTTAKAAWRKKCGSHRPAVWLDQGPSTHPGANEAARPRLVKLQPPLYFNVMQVGQAAR
jgi:hypothetical protein